MLAYGQSKTANVLFAVDAARRSPDDGIAANALHPGAVIETQLARELDPDLLAAAHYHQAPTASVRKTPGAPPAGLQCRAFV